MIYQARFIEAMKTSGVKRVAVIDDAFDPPTIGEEHAGLLLDFFEDDPARTAAGITEETKQQVIEALNRSAYDDDALLNTVGVLYKNFVTTFEPRFDPREVFKVAKGGNLENIRPLLTLLSKCDPPLDIVRIGTDPIDLDAITQETHLLFVDFYLDSTLAADDLKLGKQTRQAKSASLDRVRQIIEKQADLSPSIVLMSSHDVRSEAENFRAEIRGGAVFASRFTFIEKTKLKLVGTDRITIEDDVADALLDILQSYEFGRGLHAALDCWLKAAEDAVAELRKEIEKLELKEFSYLIRFRLAQEGQGLLEYLEWFFGECLLDGIGKAVDKKAASDARLKVLDGESYQRIDGAFDGPTTKIAELYHRVRIEAPRSIRGQNYRLGDLYAVGRGDQRTLEAVMTPDCDLIPRAGGQRRTQRLLTVKGHLKGFDAPEASVSDFIILEDKPYNINWRSKDLTTREFDNWPLPQKSPTEEDIHYLGTLRPLYAQELQRDILHDLGRVGLSVAPAIGMTAAVTVIVRELGGKQAVVSLQEPPVASAYIVPSRGGTDKAVVIFRRRFVKALVSALAILDTTKLAPNAIANLNRLKAPEGYVALQKRLQHDLRFEEPVDFGILLTGKSKFRGVEDNTWCLIRVVLEGS